MAPLEGALIGFGKAAERSHLPSYGGDFRILAVVEPDPGRRDAAERLLPGVPLYPTSRQLWQEKRLDFVDICTPPSAHCPAILDALDHGAHVLCEKPLVIRARELGAIRSRGSPKVVYCVHNWKFSAPFRRVFALLPEIGEVRRFEWHAERRSSDPGAGPKDSSWRMDPELSGGGVLFDHGWHAVYLALSIVGHPPRAVSTDLFGQPPELRVEDRVSLTLHFDDAEARIHLSWSSPRRYNGGTVVGRHRTVTIEDGALVVDGQRLPFPETLSQHSSHPDWFPPVLADFQAEINDPERRGTNLEEAALCLRALEAAAQSGKEGGRIVEL